MKSNIKITLIGLITILVTITGAILTGCLSPSSKEEVLQGFEVHEWGVFCQAYNSNIVNVVTAPIEKPVFVKKPVIYFHYNESISDVMIDVNFNGDIIVTIPNATETGGGIGWTVDIVNNSVIAPNGTEYEYLFYECQINITQGVVANVFYHGNNVTFFVKNVANYQISNILFVYGCPIDHTMWSSGITYVYIDKLNADEETYVTVPLRNESSYNSSEIMNSLLEHGLTFEESNDLIEYWEQTWFYPTNARNYAQIVYTIPEEIYNAFLPISITPKPAILNRVGLFFITDIPIIEIDL